MPTRYHAHQSRSIRPRWLLEEIGAPYRVVRIDLPVRPASQRASAD